MIVFKNDIHKVLIVVSLIFLFGGAYDIISSVIQKRQLSIFEDKFEDEYDAITDLLESCDKASLDDIDNSKTPKQLLMSGMCFNYGRGVEENINRAIKILEQAASGGSNIAHFELGWIFYDRDYYDRDLQKSFGHFRVVAESGSRRGLERLCWMFAKGEGVVQDYIMAHMWCNLAAAHGQGIDSVRTRNELERKMTAEQISAAQQYATDWKPSD